MKLPGITTRLFLAVLATATLVTLAMIIATRVSFDRGFIGYLNEQAVQRMNTALPNLQRAYAQHGNWEFVRNQPHIWFGLVGAGNALPPGANPNAEIPEPMATDLLGAGRRLTLLDAQRQRVIGFPYILANSVQREIVVGGVTVGWLAIAPIQSVTDAAALRFREDQSEASIVTGSIAVLLSMLIAWWVARAILAPVRRVAAATHRLAAGDYATRVAVQGETARAAFASCTSRNRGLSPSSGPAGHLLPQRGEGSWSGRTATVAGQDEVTQLARDFNQLALTLERNERIRREFMADVSHELRTPLAVLRGEIEAMQDGLHPPTPEQLQLLHAEVTTLSQLVGDLHELALADVGALTYDKSDFDLRELMEQGITAFRPRCTDRGLQLTFQSLAVAAAVFADPARLHQLLHNLLDNALRYTAAGGQVHVRLSVTAHEAVIDVQDSAPGVPAELLPRLFERFFRIDASRGRESGGSGLGLPICRSIVQAHGGSIEARPSSLGGVWFEVRLPLARTHVESTS